MKTAVRDQPLRKRSFFASKSVKTYPIWRTGKAPGKCWLIDKHRVLLIETPTVNLSMIMEILIDGHC
jgi:hypothetical protein